ncbi:MAG: serine/threonine protein kinase/DNA-binding NarL/FixJ family response regulator [Rhodothermales bacterium]|jgi:serine/threonine protein kinase/DNA-binding NarL/FixJ family response regulator
MSRGNPWRQPIHQDLRTQVVAVDDEFHIRLLLKEALPKKSFDVHMAYCGKEALEILSNETIDIAIIDINMPVMSGLELTSLIHLDYPRVQVILMTGQPEAFDAVACSKMNASDLLLKPITRDRLLNAVDLAKKAAKDRPTRFTTPTRSASMTVVLAEDLSQLDKARSAEGGKAEPKQAPPKLPRDSSREELSSAMSQPDASPLRQGPRVATVGRGAIDSDVTPSDAEPFPEREIGGYTLIKPLAVSDFGIVYLVEKREGESWQRYGMKVISFDNRDLRTPGKVEHLLSEAEIIGRIEHPNIVKPVEVGIDETSLVPFIVHAFEQGCPLSVLMPEKMLDFYLRVRVLAQTASALEAMHERDLCHRTLKPENIILNNAGHVRLLDFGFASIPISNLDVQSILHRLAYHAPETLTESVVLPASDVYTLAMVAYSLFTGANPFGHSTPQEVTHAIHNVVPQSLHSRIPKFPQDLSALIDCALSKDPLHRPTSAEISGKLNSILERMVPRTDIALPAYKESKT